MRRIPKVDRMLEWPEVKILLADNTRPDLIRSLRATLERIREEIRGGLHDEIPGRAYIMEILENELFRQTTSSLKPLINGTGVIIHTNLGRSPLADAALDAIREVACGYSNLEFDLDSGERGTRYSHVESLLCELTGAESALVVNNNAGAVILALSSMAQGRDVIVSRGELVEIGGSFRIPDVMRQSGANLVEVGTTNRTGINDFLSAITDRTALFMKVHTSNFSIVGFTAEASVAEMASLGAETGIPVLVDAGSGCLLDLAPFGITGEPPVGRYIEMGADVVTFSGDKLLGGPQAGIIIGRRTIVEPMKRHPLLRALRMDKLSLAALEATLRLYRDERLARNSIPTLRMLTSTPEEISRRATTIIRRLRKELPDSVTILKHPGESSAGGGSFPLLQLPTTMIEIRIAGKTPHRIESLLRGGMVPVIGRIQKDRFLLDVRTLLDHDIHLLADSIRRAAETKA